ncbi:hypothetical protein J3F83DRAFT_722737 [Trichoderma novae-zelandiae]
MSSGNVRVGLVTEEAKTSPGSSSVSHPHHRHRFRGGVAGDITHGPTVRLPWQTRPWPYCCPPCAFCDFIQTGGRTAMREGWNRMRATRIWASAAVLDVKIAKNYRSGAVSISMRELVEIKNMTDGKCAPYVMLGQ